MRPIHIAFLASLLLGIPGTATTELVVIVNPDSGVETMTRDDVVNIFMGRYQKLPSGVEAFPVDQKGGKAAFYQGLISKELPEVQSYWARLVFSGQGSPPRQLESAGEVLDVVVNNKGAIGYVDRDQLNGRVKEVLALIPEVKSHP
jgi:ABC-type phosphate transport system substrate-binding protein